MLEYNKLKQSGLDFDFVSTFETQLNSIPHLSPEDGKAEAEVLLPAIETVICRKAVALVLRYCQKDHWKYELWVEDPRDLSQYPSTHANAETHAKMFLEERGARIFDRKLSAYLLEDIDGQYYLLAETDIAQGFKFSINSDADAWKQLASTYNLKAIIGRFAAAAQDEQSQKRQSYNELLLEGESFDSIRENSYFRSVAKRHHMTNFQYMRFRMQAEANHNAGYNYSDEEIAETVAQENATQENCVEAVTA